MTDLEGLTFIGVGTRDFKKKNVLRPARLCDSWRLFFPLFENVLVRSPHRKGKAHDCRPDCKSDYPKRRKGERECDKRKHPRNFRGPFHPPRLKDIPNDQFKNDNANDEHEEALNRLPLNHEPDRERDVNESASDGRNETDKHDEDRERNEVRDAN